MVPILSQVGGSGQHLFLGNFPLDTERNLDPPDAQEVKTANPLRRDELEHAHIIPFFFSAGQALIVHLLNPIHVFIFGTAIAQSDILPTLDHSVRGFMPSAPLARVMQLDTKIIRLEIKLGLGHALIIRWILKLGQGGGRLFFFLFYCCFYSRGMI